MTDPVTRTRPTTWARVARRTAAVASVVVLVATGASAAGWKAVTSLTGNITTIDVSNDLGTDRPAEGVSNGENQPLNILVMGTDTRTGQGRGYGSPSKTSSGLGHSDTTILLHVSADRSHALAVSIPRDSWVTRPACGKAKGSVTGKFNVAFSLGGPACTIKAVEKLTGVRIDHFVVVDFKGFIGVVDALGGVQVCLKQSVNDHDSGLKLSAGTHVLDGNQALAFARVRHNIGDGSDISRISRQQVFLSALIQKATAQNVLTDLPALYGVLDATTKSLTTDPALGSVDQLKDLALSLKGLTPSKVHFVTVPWVPRGDGANIVWAESKAAPIWQSMIDDTVWPPPASKGVDGKPLTVAPEAIRVNVQNGSGIPGAGRKAAEALRQLGFVVVSVGNAPTSDVAATTVLFDKRYDQSARTLTFATQATTSSPTGKGRTLTLVVGKDWKGTQAVTVAKPSSSAAKTTTGDQQTCVG